MGSGCCTQQQKKKHKQESQEEIKIRVRNAYLAQKYISQMNAMKSIPMNVNYNYQSNQPLQYPYGVNPYQQNNKENQRKTHEELLKQENEKHQKLMQKMRKDGVNVNDYYKFSGLFYQCPICSKQFSQDERPNLRNCGHFVCNNMSCYQLECVVPCCRQKSAIKLNNYWPWIIQSNQTEITYNFVINYWGISDLSQIKGISENKTFSYVINMSPFTKSYFQMIPKQHRMITIGPKMFFYDEVKEKTIKSLATTLKLKKSSVAEGFKNKINCYNRLLGGILNHYELIRSQKCLLNKLD